MSPCIDIIKEIENLSSLPTLPLVIEKLTRLLESPNTSAEEVGKAITNDQALATKVLRLVNSAFYGFPGKISTITHAIVILGFSTVKNVVLTASIFEAFSKKGKKSSLFNLEEFWLHSIACGAAASAIATHNMAKENREECFIAGLIHDIGKLLLFQYFPAEFEKVLRNSSEKGILLFESEKSLLRCTHAQIGGFLVEKWNLPFKLQEAVKNHHNPSSSKEVISSIVHCADILCRALDFGNGGDNKIPLINEEAWLKIGMDNIDMENLLENISDEFEKASVFIQLASS